MLFEEEVFIGVVINSNGRRFFWVALNKHKEILTFQKTSLEKLLVFIKSFPHVTIGLETPAIRSRHGKSVISGLEFYSQPARSPLPAWQEIMENRNIHPPVISSRVKPDFQAPGIAEFYRQAFMFEHVNIIHVNAYCSLCCLLGQNPLPRSSLEGKIQRQLVLAEQGINLPDPMIYFEELTRFKLLHGVLPQKIILPLQEMNGLLCALTVWNTINQSESTLQIGNPPDSSITLPVPELQEKY